MSWVFYGPERRTFGATACLKNSLTSTKIKDANQKYRRIIIGEDCKHTKERPRILHGRVSSWERRKNGNMQRLRKRLSLLRQVQVFACRTTHIKTCFALARRPLACRTKSRGCLSAWLWVVPGRLQLLPPSAGFRQTTKHPEST